jgi:hypothetical protein
MRAAEHTATACALVRFGKGAMQDQIKAALIVVSLLIARLCSAADLPSFGPEFRVSPGSAGLAVATPAGFTVVWSDFQVLPPRIQRYDDRGSPLGNPLLAYTDAYSDNAVTDVATTGSGNLVVAFWARTYPNPPERFVRRFDALGVGQGGTVRVGPNARLAVAPDGRFFLAWNGPDGLDVHGQSFDAIGQPLSSEIVIVDRPYDAGHDACADAAASAVVAWGAGLADDIVVRRYDASGLPIGSAVIVADEGGPTFVRDPAVACKADGSFVVLWEQKGAEFYEWDVFARLYDSNTVALGPAFQVDADDGESDALGVDMIADGSFVVVWMSSLRTVYVRRFDGSGAPRGPQLRAHLLRDAEARFPSVAARDDGSFMVTWEAPLGTRVYGLYGMRACDDAGTDTDSDGVGDACDPCTGGEAVGAGARLSFGGIRREPHGNETMRFSGTFALPSGMSLADVDPTAVPIRLRVETVDGLTPIDVKLSTAAFAGSGTRGWRSNSDGSSWTYRDKTSTPDRGLVAFTLKKLADGQPALQVKAKGKNGMYSLDVGDEPLRATIVIGDSSGECGEIEFSQPECTYPQLDTVLRCRR